MSNISLNDRVWDEPLGSIDSYPSIHLQDIITLITHFIDKEGKKKKKTLKRHSGIEHTLGLSLTCVMTVKNLVSLREVTNKVTLKPPTVLSVTYASVNVTYFLPHITYTSSVSTCSTHIKHRGFVAMQDT